MHSWADKSGHPPPLPLKQRRSGHSGGSSAGSSVDLEPEEGGESYSSLCSLHEDPSISDVFSAAPSDCHAPRCPIHRIGAGRQERFFSARTPPPVPKKRLARALSTPGGCLHPHPHCSLPSAHQNYDNPLYMLTPVGGRRQADAEGEGRKPMPEAPPPPRPPLGLLTFNTPDPQLPRFFRSFHDRAQVSLDMQERHLLFLKRIARQLEARSLGGGAESAKTIESLQPGEFRLCEGRQLKKIGGAVFYPVHCQQLPGRVFSAKVYRPTERATAAALLMPLPPHVNVQQLLRHFPQCLGPVRPGSAEDGRSLESPEGGGSEQDWRGRRDSPEGRGRTLESLLSDGYAVDIEGELPGATLEDFVRDGAALRLARPGLYERRLALLLLQATQGLLHLREHEAVCTGLRPSDIALAWPGSGSGGGGAADQGGAEGAGERGAAEGSTGGGTGGPESRAGGEENVGAPVQELWELWGAPVAALTALHPQTERDAGADSDEVRLGHLLQFCLGLPDGPVPPGPRLSAGDPPPQGLLRLALLLLDPESGVRTAEAAGVLQVLLWGPQAELFQGNGPGAVRLELLASWLSAKRALLLQTLAELALSETAARPDREDVLCLQYFAAAEPDTVLKIAALLGLHSTAL